MMTAEQLHTDVEQERTFLVRVVGQPRVLGTVEAATERLALGLFLLEVKKAPVNAGIVATFHGRDGDGRAFMRIGPFDYYAAVS